MLPTGRPSLALISAYGTGGSAMSRAQVRHDDPLAGGAPHGSSLPNREWLGRALAISDFISDREFRRRGLYAEVCKPLGVRAVMKVFLPAGASFVFDSTRSRFTETDRLTLQRLIPHLG